MDFDEYEYLEKTVENPDLPSRERDSANRNGVESEKERSRSSKHGTDESERSSDRRRSKRSHSEDRERSSSRHRRDKDRGKEQRNEKDIDGNREMDKDREREKRREREREIEKERERSRRSRSRSHRDDVRDRREKSRERELRERELRARDRDGRRYRDKKEEVAEPEADPERDQRTVFAYQISLKADERDVYEFFSRAGKVRDVRLIMDRNSRRSKGVGYIEFYDAMSVPMAIALSGQPLRGQAVMVKPSEAEKNLVQSTSAAGAGGAIGPYSGGARRLYVGNLHFNITEDQLRQVFEPFGTVELVQLPLDETGHCKGFGFVQFARLEDARNAQNLNGQLEIAGRTIKVSAVSDQAGMQDVGANAGDFDDDEGGGMSLNAHSRALLMQKLDQRGSATSVAGSLVNAAASIPALAIPSASVLGAPPVVTHLMQSTVPALAGLQVPAMSIASITAPVETVGVPSECLLLKNMFDPAVETEPDFDLDIKDDVQDECQKFGKVKHIFVDKNSAGHVYLCFKSVNAAMDAQRALHGRWFAGKMITATFMLPQSYEAKFSML